MNENKGGTRTRTREVHIFLSDKEQKALTRKMVRSGLSASALIRAMLLEQKIAERPSAAYLKLYKELYLTCNNINQIARASNTIGVLDAKMANEAMAELTELIRSLKE